MISRQHPDFVNVSTEITYWKERFDSGSMLGDDFRKDHDPIIRLACDIYVRNPHGTRQSWIEELNNKRPLRGLATDSEIHEQIAQLCWERLIPGSASDQAARHDAALIQSRGPVNTFQ